MGDRAVSWLFALFFLFLLLPDARAQQGLPKEVTAQQALLLADTLESDSKTNVITATGHVEILQAERHLWADRLVYDQNANQIDARGNVTLLEPTGEALYADHLTLSDDLKNAVAEQLRARMSDNSLFAAASGRRTGGTVTELDRAVYSPCPLCQDGKSAPLWQIDAQRVIHDLTEHQVTYYNAFFELYGVPIAYTPYLSHPDPTVERKSGFLAPSFGNDSELGLLAQTPYYFALAPNYDLTFSPIFMSQEAPVLALDYRHLLPSGRYNLGGSATYATEAGSNSNPNPTNKAFRGHLEGDGTFNLTDDARWGYDLAVTTDNTYLRRYKFSNDNVLTNRLFTEKVWDRNYAALNGYAFQGLRQTDHQDQIPFAVPWAETALRSAPWRWGSQFTLDSSLLTLTRIKGLDTRRLSTTGGWEVPWASPLGDQYRLRLSLQSDGYWTDGDPETLGSSGGNGTAGRLLPRLTADWGWPWIGNTLGVTPMIEPIASFTWTLNNPNSNQIPNEDSQDLQVDDSNLFDPNRFAGLDEVEGGARITYGLRFGAFGDSGELLSGLFGQSYRISGEHSEFDPSTGIDQALSDYWGRIELTPAESFRVRYRFRIDQQSLTPTQNEVGAVFGPRRVRFNVDYISLANDPAITDSTSREEVTAGVSLGILPSLSFRAEARRNLDEDRDVWYKFGLVYRHPCLTIVAGLERQNTEQADAGSSTTLSVRFILKNLGEVSTGSGLLGSFGGG
jgi:LPS-assembly protein